MDINVFAVVCGLLLAFVGEVRLWVDLRREPSSDCIVTRPAGKWEMYATDMV